MEELLELKQFINVAIDAIVYDASNDVNRERLNADVMLLELFVANFIDATLFVVKKGEQLNGKANEETLLDPDIVQD